jgi:uncharacterized tellurite resistance protein B-like protein
MIGFFEYQYLRFKKSHLKNLVALAKADGHFHEEEVKYLYKIGVKYQLKPSQIDRIVKSEEETELQIPKEFHKKVAFLYDTVGMMLADDVIDDREMDFCKAMFKRFGFDNSLIDDMIQAYKLGGLEDQEDWDNFLEKAKGLITA